ncbi:hypothetical protein GQ54DRAFT_311794 [Martensiomyces pterosporus]|nr:hypothetical protein GQ54DRAFT_311794 [Martensiomyces pterosporus]
MTFAQRAGIIVHRYLAQIEKRVSKREIPMTIGDEELRHILERAHNPLCGVRPIKRFIEQHLVTALTNGIVDGSLKHSSTIRVIHSDDSPNELDLLQMDRRMQSPAAINQN